MNDTRITEGCRVLLAFEDDPEPIAVRFARYQPGAGDIVSPDSPVGLAIAGASPGTTTTVETGDARVEVTVIDVEAPM